VWIVRIRGVAIQHRQRDLDGLDGHAHDAHHPHPEHRTRPAQGHGDGHTTDIAEAHCRRQRGGQRLKMAEDALAVLGKIMAPADQRKAVGQ
jgi:hypothetical protein